MPIASFLEEFDIPKADSALEHVQPVFGENEVQKLNVFEKGYRAGWDDLAAALASEHQRVSADFAANLSDLSFTYFEARSHVLSGVETLVKEVFGKIVPHVAQHALPHLVWEQISDLLEASASTPLKILVGPGCRADIEALFPLEPGFPLTIVEEPTLSEGQVFVKSGNIEEFVDISSALAEIESGIADFFSTQQEGLRSNG